MSVLWKKLLRATGLTRGGRLEEATREIQRALAGDAGAKSAPRTVDARFEDPVADAGPTVPSGDFASEPASGPAPTHAPAPATAPAAPAPPRPGAPPADDPEAVLDAERPPGRFLDGRAVTPFGTRDFKLHVPGGEGAALRGRPLVVLLHGCKQDPEDFARGTGMNRLADRLGAYVLYPAQGARSNAMRCWNWFQSGDQKRGTGEPALLAAMVEDVVREHGIDRDRVYVAGLSAGGAMAAILAKRYPDVFAAAGVHSGLAPGAANDVASAFQAMSAPRPPAAGDGDPAGAPLIVFQGDADTTVHPGNARQVLASLLGDRAHPTEQSVGEAEGQGHGWTRAVFAAPEAAPGAPSRAELWLVHGLAHAWSGGSAGGSYTDPAGPDASREMLRFFLAHPHRAPRGA
jgi:poly(hydroxyalkanoate) depolymerase family esterase